MVQTHVADTAGTSAPVPRRRSLWVPILLQVIAMVGIGALVYPLAADWFSSLAHNAERSGYVREVSSLTEAERSAALDAARSYNEQLSESLLLDPYSNEDTSALQSAHPAYEEYQAVLALNGTSVIGDLNYPRLNIGLPVYHGAGEDAITRGVGHLYGSSLPVGGPSTHAVLTSHSGLVHASLFSKLPAAKLGDTFELRVLGETLYYQVDSIETFEPFVTDSLRVREGEDRVTLFTCTPIGVNSHRLLVSAVRIDPPAGSDRAVTGDGLRAGFPWWTLVFLGGSAAVAALLFAPPRRAGRVAAASGGIGNHT